jgi:hypothetical protein
MAPHGPIHLKLEYDTSNGKKYNNTTTKSQNNDHHHHRSTCPIPTCLPIDDYPYAWSWHFLLIQISIENALMDRSDVAGPKALPRMNVSWIQSKESTVAMDNTYMAAAHISVKTGIRGTSSSVPGTLVAGDTREYRKVQVDNLVEACTSLVVVAWQLAVSRQQEDTVYEYAAGGDGR